MKKPKICPKHKTGKSCNLGISAIYEFLKNFRNSKDEKSPALLCPELTKAGPVAF